MIFYVLMSVGGLSGFWEVLRRQILSKKSPSETLVPFRRPKFRTLTVLSIMNNILSNAITKLSRTIMMFYQ